MKNVGGTYKALQLRPGAQLLKVMLQRSACDGAASWPRRCFLHGRVSLGRTPDNPWLLRSGDLADVFSEENQESLSLQGMPNFSEQICNYMHVIGLWRELNRIMYVKCEVCSRCSMMVANIIID